MLLINIVPFSRATAERKEGVMGNVSQRGNNEQRMERILQIYSTPQYKYIVAKCTYIMYIYKKFLAIVH